MTSKFSNLSVCLHDSVSRTGAAKSLSCSCLLNPTSAFPLGRGFTCDVIDSQDPKNSTNLQLSCGSGESITETFTRLQVIPLNELGLETVATKVPWDTLDKTKESSNAPEKKESVLWVIGQTSRRKSRDN
jgi:hypothetical protein